MEDEKQPQPNIIDVLKEKAATEKQLDSFINPSKAKNTIIDAASYYSQGAPKTEPEIKPSVANTEVKLQNRPIVRTYKSDMEGTIQTGHISSINIALAENKRMLGGKSSPVELEIKKAKFNRNILIISAVLIIGGAMAVFVPKLLIQFQYGDKPIPVETVSSKPVMTVDLEEKLNIRDINLSRVSTTLKERVDQSSTQLGQIKNIYFTEGVDINEKLITSQKFLDLIGINLSDEIKRTLKEPYMFGFHNYNGNQRFLILKVGSYETTFSGMLRSEANLWQDFKEVFNLSSGSTSTDSLAIEVMKFQDATFDNKDSRVVKNTKGEIVFLYSIIDQNTIVITTSVNTLREIITRISKARVITQ